MQVYKRPGQLNFSVRFMCRGQRHTLSTHTSNEREANRRAVKILTAVENGSYGFSRKCPSVEDWALRYLDLYTSAKHCQHNDHAALSGHLIPALGRHLLSAVTVSMAQAYMQQRLRESAPTTVHNEIGIIRSLWKKARLDKLVDGNPWEHITRPPTAVRVRTLSAEDEPKLLDELNPSHERYVQFMLATGLRVNEGSLLQPEWFDWDAQVLRLPGKLSDGTHVTKGAKPRRVPLFPRLKPLVEKQLAVEGALWPMTKASVQQFLKRAAKAAAIPHLSPHDLRHTFATRWIAQRGNLVTLSRILGHASVSVTEKHYVHLSEDDLLAEALSLPMAAGSGT